MTLFDTLRSWFKGVQNVRAKTTPQEPLPEAETAFDVLFKEPGAWDAAQRKTAEKLRKEFEDG